MIGPNERKVLERIQYSEEHLTPLFTAAFSTNAIRALLNCGLITLKLTPRGVRELSADGGKEGGQE